MYLWYINNICRLYLSEWTYIAQRGRKQKNRGLFQIEIQAFYHFKPRRVATRCQMTYCSIQQGSTVQQYHCQNIKSYEVNFVDVIIVSNHQLLACYEIIKLLGFVLCVEGGGITEWLVMIILKITQAKRNLSQQRNPQHDWVQNRGIWWLQLLYINKVISILVSFIANIFPSAWISCAHTWIPEECITVLYIEPLTLCFLCKTFYQGEFSLARRRRS